MYWSKNSTNKCSKKKQMLSWPKSCSKKTCRGKKKSNLLRRWSTVYLRKGEGKRNSLDTQFLRILTLPICKPRHLRNRNLKRIGEAKTESLRSKMKGKSKWSTKLKMASNKSNKVQILRYQIWNSVVKAGSQKNESIYLNHIFQRFQN